MPPSRYNNYNAECKRSKRRSRKAIARDIATRVYTYSQDERVWRILLILYLHAPMSFYQLHKELHKQQLQGMDEEPLCMAFTALMNLFGLGGGKRKNKFAYMVWIREEKMGNRIKRILQLSELGEAIVKKRLYEGRDYDLDSLIKLTEKLLGRLPFPPKRYWEHLRSRRKHLAQHIPDYRFNLTHISYTPLCKNTEVHQAGQHDATTSKNKTAKKDGRKLERTEVKALFRILKEATSEKEITRREFGGCIALYLRLKKMGWTIGEIWKAIKRAAIKVGENALAVMRYVYCHIGELLNEMKLRLETYIMMRKIEREEKLLKRKRAALSEKVKELSRKMKELFGIMDERERKKERESLCEKCGVRAATVEYNNTRLCNWCYTNVRKEECRELLKGLL